MYLKRIFTWVMAVAGCINSYSVNLTIDAGTLGKELAGQNPETITALTVAGTVDVRDFLFITDNMPSLKTLDLSGVKISAYSDREPITDNTYSFEADILPARIFAGCGIEEVVMPLASTEIGEGAFAGCRELKTVDLSGAVEKIGDMAFSGAEKLELLKGTEAVAQIGDYAFSRCALLKPVAFTKLSAIGKYAFQSCASLDSFAFPADLVSIGEGAFKQSGLIVADLTNCGKLTEVGSWAFSDMPNITRASFPALAKIDVGMFFNSATLQNVELNQSVKYFGDFSLSGTAISDENVLTGQVATIGDYALSDTKDLSGLIIPETVEYIGEGAMRNCTSLVTLESKAMVPPALGDDVWANVDKSAVALTVPEMSYSQYKSALQWQDFFNAASDVNEVKKDPVFSMKNGVLRISAQKPLDSVRIYDMKGVLAVHDSSARQSAEYDLNGYTERVYTVVCKYADGSIEIFKIGKN